MNVRLRQDRLVQRLRRSGAVTVEALAKDLGVSRRTVLRDIGTLRDQGYVIRSEPGRGGGVELDPRCIQTSARLTVPEVFALLISVAVMRASQTMPFSDLADVGLAKIERSLPRDKVRDLRAILDCLHIGELSPEQDIGTIGSIDPALLSAFETAFLERQCLRFGYTDAKGRRSKRTVEPQAMLVLPPLWYLVAYDPDRSNLRNFRMDRIRRPEIVAGAPFRRRHVPFENDVCPFRERAQRRPDRGGAARRRE